MDHPQQPSAPAPAAPVPDEAREYPGSLADDVAVGACAGLGAMALVAVGTMVALRAGLVTPHWQVLRWYFQGGTVVLLGAGAISAVMAESPYPRRLFALSSVLALAFLGLRAVGVHHTALQVGFGLAMLGGAVVWMRRPPEGADRALEEPMRDAAERAGLAAKDPPALDVPP